MTAKAKAPQYAGWSELTARWPFLANYRGPDAPERFIADVRETYGDRAVLDQAAAGDPVKLARAILEGRQASEEPA